MSSRIKIPGGLSLTELMVAVVIAAWIGTLFIPAYLRASALSEARQGLHAVRDAQEVYKASHGGYSSDLLVLAKNMPENLRLQEIANRIEKGQAQNYEIVYNVNACDPSGFSASASSSRFEGALFIRPTGPIEEE
jgi:Tfp pilus assembly protein PilE